MKKNSLTFSCLLLSLISFGQGFTEKSYDKYNVQTIEVLGHKFTVGDTLTFTEGSLPNGDFISTQLSPSTFINAGETPPHLTATYINYKFIIAKIRYIQNGLNSSSTLVFFIGKKTPVWVDVTIAITKKEILF